MAEIILPPEENEETPQVPELNIDKPTENSKVITIEFEAKKTNKVSTKDTNQQLYTTDTDAWFEFKETSLEGANGTYSVVFRNRHDGSIFQRTGDVVDGVAYYKIPHQEIRHAGAWRGQIVYTLSNGDTTSREFGYDVKGHILDGKDVREIVVEDFETLMSQLRNMKDSAELELADLVNTANQNETNRQVFFDDLVDDIDELQANYQELLDTGVLQTNINTKLEALEEEYAPKLTEVTAQLAQNEIFEGQADFVELIKNRTNYKVLSVKKIDTPYEALQVFCHDGNQHITHEWKKNNNDDFWIYNVAYGGQITVAPEHLKSTTNKSGTWTNTDGSGNVYTTEIGATFTVQINGSTLQLNHMTDNRGGMFKIVIDGDEENHVLVSCYSDEIIIKNTIIASGLSNTLHTVVGTFLGEDPDHTPTATARGWIRDDQGTPANTDRYTMVGGFPFNGLYSSSINKMLLGYGSNKEFAFNITKDGQTHWFPEHNSQGTAFKLSEPKLTIDNRAINFENMEVGRIYDGVGMQFSQEIECIFPNITEPLAKMLISYDIGIDGVLSISGKMTFEQDVLVNNGYSLMMPLAWTTNNYVLDELVTSIGTVSRNKSDNSNQQLVVESDQTYSFAAIGNENKDYIAAMTIDYPKKTYRKGESGRGNPFIFFNHRPAYPKLYPITMFEHNAKSGEVYQFYGQFAVGRINRIYDLIK